VRAGGKMYEEFVRRAIEEDGVRYVRGRVSRIYDVTRKEGDEEVTRYVVKGEDTIAGVPVEIEADMVVLATAMVSQDGASALARTLGVPYDKYGFLQEVHPKLRPVESSSGGIFLAGACQAPRDIPESVAMASAAASKTLVLFGADMLEREPVVAAVSEATCVGCLYCQRVCAYNAVEAKEVRDLQGNLVKVVASVNPGLCQGCGTCNATCPSKSVELIGFTDEQVWAQINAFCEEASA